MSNEANQDGAVQINTRLLLLGSTLFVLLFLAAFTGALMALALYAR